MLLDVIFLSQDFPVAFLCLFLLVQVNQREGLRRKEGVRTLKRPSALLPPHAVLEHVLVSLRMPDFPTDGYGLTQASGHMQHFVLYMVAFLLVGLNSTTYKYCKCLSRKTP